MLRIENLNKSFSKKLVLQIDLLEFDRGIYWIKGENGSGKSTLLKCIAGILSFRGEISLKNTSLKKSPQNYLKYVNYSDTEPVYPDFLSGMQLIKFFLECKNGNMEEVQGLINDFDMSNYINHQPLSSYSSGMLKKLSLVLSFIGNPKVLLLDEPYITLDQHAISVLNDRIVKQQSNGNSIILTSHLNILPFPTTNINLSDCK